MTSRRYARVFLVCSAVVLASSPCAVAQAQGVDTLAPGAGDRVLRVRYVPSAEERQGEVRLIARGDTAVVQTVLYSRVLKRVVGEIVVKEERNWPPEGEGEGEGAADSARYVAALQDAAIAVWRRQLRSGRDDDRVQRLVIEFVRRPQVSRVGLYALPDDFVPSPAAVTTMVPIAMLDLSPAYVERNMVLIAQDALAMSEDEADAAIDGIVSPGGGEEKPAPAAKRPPPPAHGTSAAESR